MSAELRFFFHPARGRPLSKREKRRAAKDLIAAAASRTTLFSGLFILCDTSEPREAREEEQAETI